MRRESHVRPLPSIDAIAFGIGVVALAGTYLYPRLEVAFALAVFLPSVLRELGWLKDADEWTMGVTRRAGFHALIAVAALVFAGQLGQNAHEFLRGETLRKSLIEVFVVSYLLQYWGVRAGTFRVLLGVAALLTASTTIVLTGAFAGKSALVAGSVLLAAAGFAVLAYLVKRAPRVGGWILLIICGVPLAMAVANRNEPQIVWGMVAVMVQAVAVVGVSGMALVRGRE